MKEKFLLALNKEEQNKVFSLIPKPKETFKFEKISFGYLFKSYSFRILMKAHKVLLGEIKKRMEQMSLYDSRNIEHWHKQCSECNKEIVKRFEKIKGRKENYIPVGR
jgi:hypothetical protein